MKNHDSHITSYALNLKVLLVLLILTMTSILVIKFHLGGIHCCVGTNTCINQDNDCTNLFYAPQI